MRIIVTSRYSRWLYKRIGAFDNRMSYVLGLQRLGHEVFYVAEVTSDYCYNADDYRHVSFRDWEGTRQFERLTKEYGIWPRSCLILADRDETHGLSLKQIIEVARTCDLLLNINGMSLRSQILSDNVETRVYLDLDPSKTQVYHHEYAIDQGIDDHDFHFTVGLNLGQPDCSIPTCGKLWRPYRHPVMLDEWVSSISEQPSKFTSLSSWAGKLTFDYQGQYSGEKHDSWREYASLPSKVAQEMELFVTISATFDDDAERFRRNGWFLSDPTQLRNRTDYRRFIQRSRAEFSVANNRYVLFKTGWVSDRTGRYLASGKPALVQSTGLEEHLPCGLGLLTFRDLDEAIGCIEAINSDYPRHCKAAREIAEQYFDSDKVLTDIIEAIDLQH